MFEDQKLPLKRAIFWILLSTLLISGSSAGALFYFRHLRAVMERDAKNNIVAIVQLGTDKDTLKTEYLAELLELSSDKPTNLYFLSLQEAKERLLKSPLIRSAQIKRVKPGTLYIDYRVRRPIAYLADYSNTCIDEEGYLIPFSPFFTPKKLPEIVHGSLECCVWGTCLKSDEITSSLRLIQENPHLNITRIDLSQYNASSYGRREIILVLEKHLLRLSTDAIEDGLKRYLLLEEQLKDKDAIVDLRIPKLAFIKLGFGVGFQSHESPDSPPRMLKEAWTPY